jgi:hypothetical protein
MAVLILALAALVWGPLLRRSFWVDEAGMFWMVHEGWWRAIQKTLHWPGQSLLYSAIESFFCLGNSPWREFLMRVPSVIGICSAAYFLFRIAERQIGQGAGLAAVVLFVFHPGVTAIGFQARPYGLALGASTASFWMLMEWERTRSRMDLVRYVAASILVIYLHYFFAAIFAVQFLYVVWVYTVERRRERIWEWAAAAALIAVSVVPLIPHLKLLVGERNTLPFINKPELTDLAELLTPVLLAAGLIAAAWIVGFVWQAPEEKKECASRPFLLLVAGWWLFAPVFFMLVSRATPMRILVPRYVASSYCAQALLLTWLGFRLFGAIAARVWALVGVMLFAANPLLALRAKAGNEELLPVIRVVREHPEAPTFFPSLLPESMFYNWRAGIQPDSYLFAPLVAYPIPNPFLPLPVKPTEEVRAYVSEMLDTRLASAREVLFVSNDEQWPAWITERMARAGFHFTAMEIGHYRVFVFDRS